jgi:hypothetical protein
MLLLKISALKLVCELCDEYIQLVINIVHSVISK